MRSRPSWRPKPAFTSTPRCTSGPDGDRPPGFNTAIVVAPDGTLAARTRKLHLPVTAGYYEDRYFRPGDTGFPVVALDDARFGFPTCWDQWFPEVARSYALLGADVIVYPTAIGSEPDHPGFDTEPLWEQVIRANGIANGTFMVVPNRIGTEGRSRSTAPRSSAIPTGACSRRRRATNRPSSSPTSTSISGVTGSRSSRSSRRAVPTRTEV